jgi:hypothetical protein
MHSGHVHDALVVVVVEAHCIVVETMTRLRRVYLGRGCVDWAAWTDVVRAFVLRCCAAFFRVCVEATRLLVEMKTLSSGPDLLVPMPNAWVPMPNALLPMPAQFFGADFVCVEAGIC